MNARIAARWPQLSTLLLATMAMFPICATAQSDNKKPNIVLIVSDDFGYGDSGPYGGGEGRGMPTPIQSRVAAARR